MHIINVSCIGAEGSALLNIGRSVSVEILCEVFLITIWKGTEVLTLSQVLLHMHEYYMNSKCKDYEKAGSSMVQGLSNSHKTHFV